MDPHAYRLSRCTDPSNAPQQVHWAVMGETRVERELVTAVAPHVARAALPDVIAEIKAVLQRIATCQAVDPDDIKNITRDRDLFEIRFQLESFGLLVRIYTAEPEELPRHVIALRVHQKVVGVSDTETADLQNSEIDVASKRLALGRPTRWGLL